MPPNRQGTVNEPSMNRKRGARAKFVKPTTEEAKAYAAKIGMTEADAEDFRDHFESNGWKVGGKAPMKDWKAAMRRWNRNAPNFKKPAAHNPTTRRAEKASREYREEPIPIPNLEDDDQ